MTHSLFAEELQARREAAGLSQQQLAEAINYSPSLVGMVESGKRAPSADFASRIDDALKADGLFGRIRRHSLRQDAVPEWFRSWQAIEQQATALRAYNPLVVYGLVQTEAYAHAQLVSGDGEQAETRLVARMERQRDLFGRDRPPSVVVILEESVLHRKLGSAEIMAEQLDHLARCPATVQVLPSTTETTLGLDGAFELARLDGRQLAYAETPIRGFVIDSAEVSSVEGRWEIIRGEALPARQSRDLIMEVAETWRSRV
jgi:transcriptional regulator with XRE-family HTH domain